jgi:predicted phosphodiesterase
MPRSSKTRLQISSDLHSEFYGPQEWKNLLDQFKGEADILVLAGDIVPLRFLDQVRDVLGPFCEKYEHVIYVPGNHEFYGCDVIESTSLLGTLENELHNLVVLKNSEREVRGIKFYGGTMWFPDLPNNWKWKDQLNDFHLIRRFEPWVYEQNKAFHAGYNECVTADHVVVSHHLPSMGSTPERYRPFGIDSLNAFFVDFNTNPKLLAPTGTPKLWLHGHTHTACDYELWKTRVICNPFGYPYEIDDFPKEAIVEI